MLTWEQAIVQACKIEWGTPTDHPYTVTRHGSRFAFHLPDRFHLPLHLVSCDFCKYVLTPELTHYNFAEIKGVRCRLYTNSSRDLFGHVEDKQKLDDFQNKVNKAIKFVTKDVLYYPHPIFRTQTDKGKSTIIPVYYDTLIHRATCPTCNKIYENAKGLLSNPMSQITSTIFLFPEQSVPTAAVDCATSHTQSPARDGEVRDSPPPPAPEPHSEK